MGSAGQAPPEEPRRLRPLDDAIRQLFTFSGNRCAFEGCGHPLLNESGLFVAETCHIAAAMPDGPRFDASMTNDQRRDADNLLLLCHRHHREVDDDVEAFTVDRLRAIKAAHESRWRAVAHLPVGEDVFRAALGDIAQSAVFGAAARLRSGDEHFAEFDAPGRLLRHDLPLVGRETELAGLVGAARDPDVRAVVLSGRGGIGKTRLLRAAAIELQQPDCRVWFVTDPALLTADVLERLPLRPTVLVVDDAHRVDADLTRLLAATRRGDPLTVVLACRPAGAEAIRDMAAGAGLESREVCELPSLGRLSAEQSVALAQAALGDRAGAERLAEAGAEVPLVAVVGGSLIAQGAFEDHATGAEQLRREVMHRFAAELQGRVTSRLPQPAARDLLVLVAALQPLDVSDAAVIGLIAEELSARASQVRTWLGELLHAGLLQHRGNLRRIVPEMLGDAVLEEACLGRPPRLEPTGRAEELWARFCDSSPTALLVNLGELDWRSGDTAGSLVHSIWDELRDELAGADALGRHRLIGLLAPAAVFSPLRALELVDMAMSTPAAPSRTRLTEFDETFATEGLPRLLAQAGRHADHARATMERLWSLGRDDARELHSNPNHPLRVLRELAGYKSGPEHHQALVDLIAARCGDPDVGDHAVLPIQLADTLLTREEERILSSGPRTVTISRQAIDTDATEQWRSQIRALLLSESRQPDPRRQVAAARVFEEALRLAYGSSGIPEHLRELWRADQLRLLETAAQIAAAGTVAEARVTLSRAVAPYADDEEPWDDVRAAAASVCASLAGEREQMISAIASPWDIFDEDLRLERDHRVAAHLRANCVDGWELGEHLHQLFSEMTESGLSDSPTAEGPVACLLNTDSSFAAGLWEWCVHNSDSPAAANIGALALSAKHQRGDRTALIEAGRSKHPQLRRVAAQNICSRAGQHALNESDLDLLRALGADSDHHVRSSSAIALLRLGQLDAELACELALEPAWDAADHRSADLLWNLVANVGVADLDGDATGRVLHRLVAVPQLEHFADKVLQQLGHHHPEAVIDIWLGRLRYRRRAPRYRAVPFRDPGTETLGEAQGAQRVALMRRLLAGGRQTGAGAHRDLGKIFWRLAVPGLPADKPDDQRFASAAPGIEAAWNAWIEEATSPDADYGLLAAVLEEVPWQLVITSPQRIAAVIERSPASEPDLFSRALHTAVRFGSFGRRLGSDSPRWRATSTHTRSAADQLPAGAPAELLFRRWAELADRELEDSRREDELEEAGWQ